MKRLSYLTAVVRLCAVTCGISTGIGVFSQLALFAESPDTLRVLFLGDEGHHRPADRFKQLQPVLAKHEIELEYSASLADLSPAKLAGYDCVLVYANWTQIAPSQEQALLDFVQHGGGFVPLHCASYCFLNSPKYVELVGGQFLKHGTGVFKETIVNADHPVMKGLAPIESWDETYVHTKHNPNRTVLAERRDDQGAEPYTWVREFGQGRVFYTAWGHDERTWSNAGFQTLVENGIRWSSAHSFTRLAKKNGLKPFEYMDAPGPLPNYTPNAQWGTQAEPIKTMQKPLDPSESIQHVATFPEFETSLFAADPDIVKPIWISWDERGRLWIAETVDYPNNLQKPGEGHDRLKICEDTDGDGKADKFTVFADQLSIPTGFVFANGGVVVIHGGKTEFLKDNDGDDKADERKILFTGWGTSDTHATASNLHYGFDNWIWGTVGYSGFSGTVGGKEIRFGQGIYRFKADGSKLEFVRSSNNNTWGLGISEDNIIFGSTANGNASMYMPIPNRYYEAVSGWSGTRLETIADSQRFYPLTEKVRQVDYHGKYTAGAGSALYTARNFPREYWNRVQFVAEPTGHLLGKFHIEARGSDFVSHNGRSFLASDDEWTAPVCAEVGPDGSLWVSDWYNYIIQHNPTPRGFGTGKGNAYETPLRDKVHGRIYKIKYKEAKAAAPLRLDKATPQEWVATLKNDNLLWRMHAQRLLVSRGQKDVVPALCALVGDTSLDAIGLNPAAIHALWTLEGLGALDGSDAAATQAAVAALKHPSAAVRRAAVTVLPRNEASLQAVMASKTVEDTDAQVRLATLLAISELPPSPDAAGAVFASLGASQNADDRWIPDAATTAAAKNDAGFLKAVLASYKPAATSTDAAPVPTNLLPNPSFETQADGKPAGWRTVTHSGRGTFAVGDTGHTGSRSVQISSENGADVSWTAMVSVKPRTDYKFTGWIKTQGVAKRGGAHGAMFNIHELQDPIRGGTKAITGDTDWTQVQLNFNSGEMTSVTINCLFGGWGPATGTAWFDDVELTPAPGSELAGETGRVVRLVTAHYAQRGPSDTIVQTLVALKGASPGLATAVLDGLVSGWPEDKAPMLAESDKASLTSVMNSMPESARDRLLALAQRWGQPEIFGANFVAIIDALKKQVTDAGLGEDQRGAAAKRLIALDAKIDNARLVIEQISLLSTPSLGAALLNALTDSRDRDTGKAVVAGWEHYTPGIRKTAVGVLMRRPDWTRALLDAVEKKVVGRTDLATEQWSQLKQNPNREIAGRAGRLSSATGVAVSADREEVVKKLLPLAKEHGTPARGKEVFTANCAACHTFNGQGGKVGPDLSGIGAKDRSEILTDILDPNRSVEANYRLWNLTTKDGEVLSGRLDTDTQTSVEILDTTGQKHPIQRSKIATLESSQQSIMPTGFESIPPDDIKSLLDYLGQAHL
ncbi:MAG TPA: PVC-type heme-binding CxxCH protein [Candidatus Limnocylindria bacterium]|nr:PVC-type heme-binding CxxCH protein [Candidatus Limnocylindria bacterium]